MANEQDMTYERLRAEIIVLSCYLKAQQITPSQSHPGGDTWNLFAALSTLLVTGTKKIHDARNVNAVLGTVTENTIDYLVMVENPRQDAVSVARMKSNVKHNTTIVPLTLPAQTAEQNEEAVGGRPWHVLSDITPSTENGRKLLADWQTGAPEK